MERRSRRILSLSALVLAAIAPAPCSAQELTESLVHEGVELRHDHRDVEALAVFERALAIDSSARSRAQVALAEQALGFWVEAERDLDRALSEGDGPWFVEHDRVLRAAIETIRSHLASLEVTTNVAGAELWIHGARAGVTPLAKPLRVAAGDVEVEARAPRFQPRMVRTHVDAGSTVQQKVELLPAPEPVTAPPEVRPPKEDPRAGRPEATARRTTAWILAGAGVAFLGVAGVGFLVRNADAAAYDDDARCFYGAMTRDQRCGGYRNAATAAEVVSLVGLGAAVAAAGVSIALFANAGREPSPRAANLGCTLSVGVSCAGSF